MLVVKVERCPGQQQTVPEVVDHRAHVAVVRGIDVFRIGDFIRWQYVKVDLGVLPGGVVEDLLRAVEPIDRVSFGRAKEGHGESCLRELRDAWSWRRGRGAARKQGQHRVGQIELALAVQIRQPRLFLSDTWIAS